MRWHLFRYRISVNYYRLKWLKQYEHFSYAILLRNADDIPWMGIVVRLDWSGTNFHYFFIFDGISIGYVEIISRRAAGVKKIGRFRAGVHGKVFLTAIKMFWNWKNSWQYSKWFEILFWRQFAEKCILIKMYALWSSWKVTLLYSYLTRLRLRLRLF